MSLQQQQRHLVQAKSPLLCNFPMQHLQPLSGTCSAAEETNMHWHQPDRRPRRCLAQLHITEFCLWLASLCKHATSMMMRQLKITTARRAVAVCMSRMLILLLPAGAGPTLARAARYQTMYCC